MKFAVVLFLNGRKIVLSVHPTSASAGLALHASPFKDAQVVSL
jgi:hypothetical protein